MSHSHRKATIGFTLAADLAGIKVRHQRDNDQQQRHEQQT